MDHDYAAIPLVPCATTLFSLPGYEKTPFDKLRDCSEKLSELSGFDVYGKSENILRFIKFCDSDGIDIEKAVIVNDKCEISIFVLGKRLPGNHELSKRFNFCRNETELCSLLVLLSKCKICCGNTEREMVSLVPEGRFISYQGSNDRDVLCEKNSVSKQLTIREARCKLLLDPSSLSARCHHCTRARDILRLRLKRRNTSDNCDITKKRSDIMGSNMGSNRGY